MLEIIIVFVDICLRIIDVLHAYPVIPNTKHPEIIDDKDIFFYTSIILENLNIEYHFSGFNVRNFKKYLFFLKSLKPEK